MDDTKVNVDVRVTRLRDESRMTFGVDARLVDPGVQGRVIDVVDLLTRCHVMVEFDGIGASSTEGVTRVERFHKLQGIHVRLDVRRGLFEAGPLIFPHFNNVVPVSFFVGSSHKHRAWYDHNDADVFRPAQDNSGDTRGSLNETTVGLGVNVLMAGRTIDVLAMMTYIVFEPHFQFETDGASASTKTDGVLMAGRGFSRMDFGEMSFEASVTEKVAMTVTTTFGGLETARVGVKKIGALFLETGAALDFFVWTSMTSCMVIGFQAVGTHVTGPEKPWETVMTS